MSRNSTDKKDRGFSTQNLYFSGTHWVKGKKDNMLVKTHENCMFFQALTRFRLLAHNVINKWRHPNPQSTKRFTFSECIFHIIVTFLKAPYCKHNVKKVFKSVRKHLIKTLLRQSEFSILRRAPRAESYNNIWASLAKGICYSS